MENVRLNIKKVVAYLEKHLSLLSCWAVLCIITLTKSF